MERPLLPVCPNHAHANDDTPDFFPILIAYDDVLTVLKVMMITLSLCDRNAIDDILELLFFLLLAYLRQCECDDVSDKLLLSIVGIQGMSEALLRLR